MKKENEVNEIVERSILDNSFNYYIGERENEDNEDSNDYNKTVDDADSL